MLGYGFFSLRPLPQINQTTLRHCLSKSCLAWQWSCMLFSQSVWLREIHEVGSLMYSILLQVSALLLLPDADDLKRAQHSRNLQVYFQHVCSLSAELFGTPCEASFFVWHGKCLSTQIPLTVNGIIMEHAPSVMLQTVMLQTVQSKAWCILV